MNTSSKKTTDQFRNDLISKSIPVAIIGEYHTAHTKTTFRCLSCGHEWLTRPANVLNGGTGCPPCAEERRRQGRCVDTNKFRAELAAITDSIQHLEECNKISGSLTKFVCLECDHTWRATTRQVIRSKGNCPGCGNKSGYKIDKPGYAYVVKFPNFIKYGITNSPETRLSRHRQRGMIEIIECRKYKNGKIPLEWEQKVKEHFGGKFVSKSKLVDGWTETLRSDLLESVIATMPTGLTG